MSSQSNDHINQITAKFPGCSRDTASNCLYAILPPDPPSDDDDTQSQQNDDKSESEISALVGELDLEDQRNKTLKGASWMPKLPTLSVSEGFIMSPHDPSVFELRKFLGAIQAGQFDAHRVRDYLGLYDKDILDAILNADIDGYPAMFYVVATNDIGIIRQWIKHGGDPNVTWGPNNFPLIAFSIINGGQTMYEAWRTLATLLRFGADCRVIPQSFYDPYCRVLPEDGPSRAELHDIEDQNKRWCTAEVRACLAGALNLSQRYDLDRSSKTKPYSGREKEVLFRQSAEEVMGLRQMIVAQSIAARWLQRKLLVNLARQKRKPFILVFAGPSGHGKTELARRFGDLISSNLHVVDCTIFKHDNELFGPRPPYSGHEDGSPLNNFLVLNAGERAIVFMDEFEKTSDDIHNTLLLPFQDGRYEDRRNGKIVDCSKTIWILATNKLDDSIHSFCDANKDVIFQSEDDQAQDRLVEKLLRQLRTEFIGHFGAPLAGRITEILPFLIFSPHESAVIVHRVLMDLEREVARRVHLSTNKEDDIYVGNINIRIKKDAVVCSKLADDGYDKKTGARSIARAVERGVEDSLISQYLKDGDEFDENQPTTYFDIDVNVDGEVEVRLALDSY
ncbi:P-loop containing nucleoside triphosphate hydrolase protein [Annulohypoxylon maeteangense]|uniref:P-loop containing nucleoside triphosphate hydrolase protein n=1 Tax=Annulohypoxylon maeteangense TaxID=1927788 RepID=UPI002007DA34|nr:P-loop containing nucleoside triphosphate hydrolase protein [Annulohypoxylon maeteangense]KAI0879913.1 P-loop containing nucleoside triphosphate hydrolase protein [Annulohypoxylon maeteangense]